jgi:hypothetical protein
MDKASFVDPAKQPHDAGLDPRRLLNVDIGIRTCQRAPDRGAHSLPWIKGAA